jgi:two-component system LytT family response regulator
VVFVTAHDRYALQAFDTHAIDYLLKPITPSRFGRAIERVRTAVSGRERLEQHARLLAFLETVLPPATGSVVPRGPEGGRRFTIRDGDRYLFVSPAEVDWIDSEGNYARLHVGKASYRMRATLAELERTLDPAEFVRIHRATIVNRSRIREVRPRPYGECLVILRDGRELAAARHYRRQLLLTPP